MSWGPGCRRRGILQPELVKEIYQEIEKYKPAMECCLAPKKAFEKQGASSLRAGVSSADAGAPPEASKKSAEELDRHARTLYEWVTGEKSRLRMLMNWQCAGGLSYVAAVHQRGVQCFVGYGNSKHNGAASKGVTLEDFQRCVRVRHAMGNNGIPQTDKENQDETNSGKKDFEP